MFLVPVERELRRSLHILAVEWRKSLEMQAAGHAGQASREIIANPEAVNSVEFAFP